MVSCDGLAAKHLSCPRDPKLLAYFTRVAELHAAWHPGSVWLDDDMSYRNRAPTLKSGSGLPGCFCDGCIAAFSKADGRAWTREALVKALRGRTPDDRNASARWNDWSRAVMGTLAQTIAEAVHRVSPETVLGYQFGGLCKEVARGLFVGGGRPIRLRPGGGAYWDTDPHQQLDKAYMTQLAATKARRESWVAAFAPEIESCPRTFASRTAQGILLEAFENLALGTDFVSMFVADTRGGESVGFFADRLFPRLQAAHPFLASYRAANAGTLSCGFSMACPTKLVACRGVPIAGAEGPGVRSLGPLPAVRSIPVRKNGSSWLGSSLYSPDGYTMQIVSSVALTNYYAQCDAACGGRMPVVFDEAVMAFVLPRVREDGTLATVAVVNASIDRQDPVSVRLRGVPEGVRCAVWHAPEEKDMELPLARRDGETRVTLPRLGAWQCGYLSVAGH